MKTEIGKMAEALEKLGYEIVEAELIPWPSDTFPHGAYQLKVTPYRGGRQTCTPSDHLSRLRTEQEEIQDWEQYQNGQALLKDAEEKEEKTAALDVIDFDQTLKSGLEGLGFPQIAVREDADITKLREERARMQERQRQQAEAMEQQKQIVGNMDKLNQPAQPGSALDMMERQMMGGNNG
jgi:hypothetical protein